MAALPISVQTRRIASRYRAANGWFVWLVRLRDTSEQYDLACVSYSFARNPRRKKQRPWKEALRPDYNMGVPQLMHILEPNVVWEHAAAFNARFSHESEAGYCPGVMFGFSVITELFVGSMSITHSNDWTKVSNSIHLAPARVHSDRRFL
jgi:hypothetical protein